MSDEKNRKIMADNIRYYMNLNGVNSADMLKVLDVPSSTFSFWINAKSYPRIDKIQKMADYFGISKSDLVEDHNAEPDDGMTPATKILFQSLRGATEEDILQAAKIIEALRK